MFSGEIRLELGGMLGMGGAEGILLAYQSRGLCVVEDSMKVPTYSFGGLQVQGCGCVAVV